jgi:hypothetical protein
VFSDPQTVTYAAAAKNLPAIGRSADTSEYQFADTGNVIYKLTLTRGFKARNRVVARLRRDSVVGDPLVTGNNIPVSMTATFTIDMPNSGLALADGQNLGKALVAWLSDANILKLLNGET